MTHLSGNHESGNQVVAVTGATGFVGQRLVQHLVELGFQVRVLTRRRGAAINLPSEIQIVTADLTDPLAPLESFLDGVDVLYHCAGELYNESRMYALHVEATRRLAKAAQQRIHHWVQLSSIGVYGWFSEAVINEHSPLSPVGLYEQTKAMSDEIVTSLSEAGGYTLSVLRPANIFGSGMPGRSLNQLLKMVRRGVFFFIGKPGATVNFIHVDNVVEALLLCGSLSAAQGGVYNISDTYTMEDFIAIVVAELGCSQPWLRFSESLVRVVVNVFGFLPWFPLTKERVNILVSRVWYPTDHLQDELGYVSHVSLKAGIREYIQGVNG